MLKFLNKNYVHFTETSFVTVLLKKKNDMSSAGMEDSVAKCGKFRNAEHVKSVQNTRSSKKYQWITELK